MKVLVAGVGNLLRGDDGFGVIVVDALELDRPPGTLVTMRPDVLEPHGPDDLADMHYANPDRALMLAGALNLLPKTVWLIGCQPADPDRLGEGLSPTVAAAVEPAVAEVRRLVAKLAP